MKKVLNGKLKKIIREVLQEIINEDIKLNTKNGERKISVTPDNEAPKHVDKNNSHNPYIFIDNQRGYKVYSIFQRQKTEDNITDANPLLNALKQRKGWDFENAKKELMVLLRNFVAAIKLLPKYDIQFFLFCQEVLPKVQNEK